MESSFFIILTLFHLTLYPMQQPEKSKVKEKIEYIVRKGTAGDRDKLKKLYIKVSRTSGGLVRTTDEITDEYIDTILHAALERGVVFVAEHQEKLIGTVLKYRPALKNLAHALDEGSILVDPEYQRMGIATSVYTAFLSEVKQHHPDILRINIKVRESNPAILLYNQLGFVKEGEFKNVVRSTSGRLESAFAMVWFNPNFKDEHGLF